MPICKNRREYEESFNIFRNLNLIEDTHSALLKKIIHPRGKHGKKDAILRIFFEVVLQQPFDCNKTWEVESNVRVGGKSYADLVIYGYDSEIKGNCTIYVFENKIKGACNQRNQLYRYWYGLEHGNTFVNDQKRKYLSSKYRTVMQICYCTFESSTRECLLNGETTKIPQNKTYNRRRESMELNDHLKDELIQLISYKIHFIPFLNEVLEICNSISNERFKQIIEQYIDWIKFGNPNE